ncbi:MAG: hypothetical protein IPH05_11445 [Flavobacteriales bacterium]|jgi:hypothetical protein|nr:hypothetical protein [Flavobacteriales bacterium]MBK6549773.1 hypothetical protein [Flavobacteriales bacterium]MBK6883539.1 hypothetical protein [Flavobacteriales bacterium]MBK7102289.1 hypothetical protein [Flavobacteriales bacterium]MBK7113028.1 hypothetical protein [Flavobacteriales bacterium]
MPRKKRTIILERPIKVGVKEIKVRLDHRTIITVTSQKAIAAWKLRYPKLEVIG